MHRSLVAAAALVAGMAIAAPMLAWSADGEPQIAQAAPAPQGGMPGAGGMPGMMPGMHDGAGMHHAGMMREMMMRRMGQQLSPQQRCEERLARRAGRVAYTVAKLNLTAEQKPLWDRLQSQMQAGADRERQLCGSLKSAGPGGSETLLDRMNRREQFLTVRLQGLQQAKPALEQLYQTLTPDQKAIVDHPFRNR